MVRRRNATCIEFPLQDETFWQADTDAGKCGALQRLQLAIRQLLSVGPRHECLHAKMPTIQMIAEAAIAPSSTAKPKCQHCTLPKCTMKVIVQQRHLAFMT
jgi:hypothetical protein